MPFLNADPTITNPMMGSTNLAAGSSASASDISRVSALTQQHDYGILGTLGGDAALGVVDLFDTVGSSIPLLSKGLGIQRGDLNAHVLQAIDSPGLSQFYNENRGGIEAGSGIAGAIAAEVVARKFTKPAGLVMGALKALPYARRIATLDGEYTAAMSAVRMADKELASRGAMGIEQYIGRVGVEGGGMQGLLTATGETTRAGLVSKANWLGFAKGATHAATTEAVMATTLNQNGFLYDDDMSHNIMWMGLGLGIGGAFEKVATGYAIRKYVNSDEIRRTFADALDPDKTEAARLLWKDRAPRFLSKDDMASIGAIGHLGGSYTDYITNLLVGARTLDKTPLGVTEFGQGLQSSRNQLSTQNLKLARDQMQKVTTKGISTNGFTRFSMDSRGYGNHLDQVMHNDPGAVLGVEMLGAIPEESSAVGIHQSHVDRLDSLVQDLQSRADDARRAIAEGTKITKKFDFDANDAMIRRFNWEKTLTPVFFIDGEKATITDARVLDNWVEPTIKSTADDESTLFETFAKDGRGHNVGVDTNLNLYLPDNKPIAQADHFDMLRAYRAGQRVIQNLKGKQGVIVNLPKDANYFQLDMAEQLIRESDGKVEVNWPSAMTRESAQVESFAQKAEILKAQDRILQMKSIQADKKGLDFDPALEASKLRVRLNLPKLTAYERGVLNESDHPVTQLLRGVATMDPADMRTLTKQDLMIGAAQTKRIGDFAPTAASDFNDLMGNSFRYMLDESGKATSPIIGYQRSLTPFDWMPDNLADRLATKKLHTVQMMMEPLPATKTRPTQVTMTNKLSQAIMQSPDYDIAARTHELMDPQVQGSTLGTANQTPFGAAAKALKSRDWIGRDNPTLLAASRIQELAQRLTRDLFQREAAPLQQAAGVLNSPRNASTKMLLNQFIAHRPGWDIVMDGRKAVEDNLSQVSMPQGGTGYKFVLQRTEQNQSRWRTMFGEEMPQDAIMPTPDGRDIVLDQQGLDFMKAYNSMSDSLRNNKNQLLSANALKQIDHLPFYVPPTNIDGKFIGFTLDAENKTVPGMTVIATTQEQFAKEQARINALIADQKKTGYRFVTRDQVNRFSNIWDRAQMDMIDPGTTAIQPGKRGMGGLSSLTIDPQGVEGILSTLRSQYFNHANDVVSTMFRDQIRSAESRGAIASGVTRNRAGFYRDQQFRSIHDMYLENLTGQSPLNSPGSLVGRFYNQIEGTIDSFLSSGAPSVSKVWHATNNWIDKIKPWDKSGVAKQDFDSLTKALGPYMPFKSAAEYLEHQGAGQMPPRLKDIMGMTSRFTAATMLRMFEPAMAVMNMAGMVNAMPSVIRHLAQREGESAVDFAARVGHVATIFPNATPNGGSIGVMDMAKLMTKGFAKAWTKEAHPDFDYMRSMGFLTQEVAEFHKQFGAIETKADWERFMFGAPGAKVGKLGQDGAVLGEKGLIGWMSILTDKSEDFSRSWGHMTGLHLADTLGITGREARNNFAHDMANKMIANYNPANRPEVFQGAVGAPLGLFQSFIMNYYQRLFRYVETKDFHALGTQYAMQGGLFGVTTLPGWAEASKFFFNHSGGKVDANDTIREKFGQSAGDLLAAGTISNVPKLFGLPGVDLYSRGDTAVRLPGFNLPPGITVASKVITGMADAFRAIGGKLMGTNPAFSGTQLAEIASNTVPNRPIAGMIEQFLAHGNDTDKYGQIVSDTQGAAEAAYRVLGVKSMRQSKAVEAAYTNKNQMELKAAQDDLLRVASRAAIRSGNSDAIPGIMSTYLQNGGDPRGFRKWLKSNYEAATIPVAERQLQAVLKSPEKMGYVARLLDAGVDIKGDDHTTSYADSLATTSNFDHVNEDDPGYDTSHTPNMNPMMNGR